MGKKASHFSQRSASSCENALLSVLAMCFMQLQLSVQFHPVNGNTLTELPPAIRLETDQNLQIRSFLSIQAVTLELRQEHSSPSYALKTKLNCDEFKYFIHNSGPQVGVRIWKSTFLFLNQNICFCYSKEPSQWDGSFEHPKHMFKAMDKEIIAFFRTKSLLVWVSAW